MVALPKQIADKAGSAAYYRQRLERDFPQLAAAVDRGELSVFTTSVTAGMRKPPKGRMLALPSV